MSAPSLAISVISHGQKPLVEKLLASLVAFRPEMAFHVYVLENVQGAPEISPGAYDFPLTYWQNKSPLSLSENINLVFEKTQGTADFFCILNPDIVFMEEIFTPLIREMQSQQIDLIAPLIVDHTGAVQDSFRPFPKPLELALRYLKITKLEYQKENLPAVSYPDWIAAMFMLMPSSAFTEVGGFDPDYPLYFEDVDFCLRLRLKGMEIGVVRDVKLVHDAQRTSHRKLSYLFKHIISAVRFYRSEVYRQYQKGETKA